MQRVKDLWLSLYSLCRRNHKSVIIHDVGLQRTARICFKMRVARATRYSFDQSSSSFLTFSLPFPSSILKLPIDSFKNCSIDGLNKRNGLACLVSPEAFVLSQRYHLLWLAYCFDCHPRCIQLCHCSVVIENET